MAEASGSGPTHTQKAILAEFNSKRQRLSDFVRKIEELNAEVAEHDMVIKTLEPMEPTRKAFRLIGDVLVERTVGEALPAVVKNRDMLEATIKSMTEGMQELERQLSEMQTKYGIKLVDRQGRPVDEPPPSSSSAAAADKEGGKAGAGSSGRGPQGVLVQK